MQTSQFRHRVEKIERGRGHEQAESDRSRGAKQKSQRRSQINSQTARADGYLGAENPEGTLRPLVADDGEAALQCQTNRQKTVRQEIRSSNNRGNDR